MFHYCKNLVDISPLINWNVSNSTTFESMFEGCSKLEDISPLKNFGMYQNRPYFVECLKVVVY